MKKKLILVLLNILVMSFTMKGLTIKIGSIAPVKSPWEMALKKISREWKKISEGSVKLKIYSGGIAGSEKAMIRKIKIGTLGGGLFSNIGLTSIYSDFYALNIPLLIKSEQELNFVFKNIKPIFEDEIEKKGYKVIFWSMAGWVKFFTKVPVFEPDELKKQKLYFTTGEPVIEESWKKSGYNIIPTELKDLMMALQSGMVNSFFLPPLVAASGQYFALAQNMMSLKVAPIYSAAIISKKIWLRIPENLRGRLLETARIIAKNLDIKTKELEEEAVKTMTKNGLKINKLTADHIKKWEKESDKNVEFLKGKTFSKDIYQKINKLIQEFRKS